MFTVTARDPNSSARCGIISTDHGDVVTPLFLPVGTSATVKTLSPSELRDTKAQIILSNTYHLSQQPGIEVLRAAGGLGKFMRWDGPTLTDSGGFQVFSLSPTRKLTEDGVTFRSVYDGQLLNLTPETALSIQRAIGADIIYALDECSPYPSPYAEVKRATELTTRWAKRFLTAWQQSRQERDWNQYPFIVMQGGTFDDLRRLSSEQLSELDPPGFGIGGLSVGEPRELMQQMTALSCEILPQAKPRHLMGVGTPSDLLVGIDAGVDIFDCVLPTRNGRNGQALTSHGTLNLRNSRYRIDQEQLDSKCDCYCCQTFTRSYLHHLTVAGELLGMRLLSLHNLTYYQQLMSEARIAIVDGQFSKWRSNTEYEWSDNT